MKNRVIGWSVQLFALYGLYSLPWYEGGFNVVFWGVVINLIFFCGGVFMVGAEVAKKKGMTLAQLVNSEREGNQSAASNAAETAKPRSPTGELTTTIFTPTAPEVRLQQLHQHHAKGLISDDEYQQQRQRIIADL